MDAHQDKLKLLYTTPESLDIVREVVGSYKKRLVAIVVDEAHCIEQW